jgi:hypothetical protein
VDRLRLIAELHGYNGWLLGCRDAGLRHGRRQVAATPLAVLGTPCGTIGAALAAAGALHGGEYLLPTALNDPDAIGPGGAVRLRCYLPHETMHWFAAGRCCCATCDRA